MIVLAGFCGSFNDYLMMARFFVSVVNCCNMVSEAKQQGLLPSQPSRAECYCWDLGI